MLLSVCEVLAIEFTLVWKVLTPLTLWFLYLRNIILKRKRWIGVKRVTLLQGEKFWTLIFAAKLCRGAVERFYFCQRQWLPNVLYNKKALVFKQVKLCPVTVLFCPYDCFKLNPAPWARGFCTNVHRDCSCACSTLFDPPCCCVCVCCSRRTACPLRSQV